MTMTRGLSPVCILGGNRGFGRESDESEGQPEGEVPISRVETAAHMAKQQREDPELIAIITYLESRQLPEGLAEKDAMLFVIEAAQCYVHPEDQRLLHRQCNTKRLRRTEALHQLYVPFGRRTEIIAAYHDGKLSGHMGAAKTLDRLLLRYYWASIREDVVHNVASCEACQQSKTPHRRRYPVAGRRVPPVAPFQRVSADFMAMPMTLGVMITFWWDRPLTRTT